MRYEAKVIGSGGETSSDFDTLTAARHWAESFGNTADRCRVFKRHNGARVAIYIRDTSGDGSRWFKGAL